MRLRRPVFADIIGPFQMSWDTKGGSRKPEIVAGVSGSIIKPDRIVPRYQDHGPCVIGR